MPYRPAGLVVLAALVLLPTSIALAPQPAFTPAQDEELLVGMARQFLDALASGDHSAMADSVLENGQLASVRLVAGQPEIRTVPMRDWLHGADPDAPRPLERIWEPTVLVDGRIGAVWSRYDLHLSGQFSHCGTDLFTFLKGARGWRLTGIQYTVERQGCAPSPLGPLEP